MLRECAAWNEFRNAQRGTNSGNAQRGTNSVNSQRGTNSGNAQRGTNSGNAQRGMNCAHTRAAFAHSYAVRGTNSTLPFPHVHVVILVGTSGTTTHPPPISARRMSRMSAMSSTAVRCGGRREAWSEKPEKPLKPRILNPEIGCDVISDGDYQISMSTSYFCVKAQKKL